MNLLGKTNRDIFLRKQRPLDHLPQAVK